MKFWLFFLISIGFSAKIITGQFIKDVQFFSFHNLSCGKTYDVSTSLNTAAAQREEVCLHEHLTRESCV